MSTNSSPSPHQGPVDETPLPSGQCRYILLHPDIKGQRCACVTFTLNKSTPNISCECGHLACFHVKATEPVTDSQELENLKQRMQVIEQDKMELQQKVEILEDQLGREQTVIERVSELEDALDRSKDEVSNEIKVSYRNLNLAWNSIHELQSKSRLLEERLGRHDEHFAGVDAEVLRLDQGQLELRDSDDHLEERLEALEGEGNPSPPRGRPRRKSATDSMPPSGRSDSTVESRRRRSSESRVAIARAAGPTSAPAHILPVRPAPTLWTVHISLLPTALQGFPFERHTNAYQRCLSRGLHQTVVVKGFDADSFVSAVSKAFNSLLRDRPWIPLQAESCTAEGLAGLPMLRQLNPELLHGRYDVDFLRQHCAVLDNSGNIDSLYIAMRDDTLSWHFLRRAPVFQEGLEESWFFDSPLDTNDPFDDDDDDIGDVTRPSAGDIIPLPSLKRAASEMSRSSSFGSVTTAAEGEGSRPKVPRVYPLPNIAEVRRGVKTS